MNAPIVYHTHIKLRHVHHNKTTLTTLDAQKRSHTGRLVLEANARIQHLARKDLRASSCGAANGEDIALGFPRCIPSSNGIKIDATIM